MRCVLRPVLSQPCALSFAVFLSSVGIFTGQSRPFQLQLQTLQSLHPVPKRRVLLGDSTRQRDGESKSILQVEALRPRDEVLGVVAVEPEQQPGKSLREAWIDVVQGKCRQEKIRWIPAWSSSLSVCQPRIAQSREPLLKLNVGLGRIGGSWKRREWQIGRRQTEESGHMPLDTIGHTTLPSLHEG